MVKILSKRDVAFNIFEMVLDAPLISKSCDAGQFVIVRVGQDGERVPFTICDFDRQNGTITLLIQKAGYTTTLLSNMKAGDYLDDLAGPLGTATHLDEYNKIVLIGGGVGTAVIYPQAKKLFNQGKPADVIIGARSKDFLLFENEFKAICKNLYIATDDGSYGQKGFVTDILKEHISEYDCAFAVGPMPMMRAVCNLTQGILPTVVSMNSIMIDGTGMCGGCRLSVGGKIKYACVDGPEFDGHLIDWQQAISRSRTYAEQEKQHVCRLSESLKENC